ncbi:membrane protein insertase YidC [Bdellovibrionota bacterium FG-2]
MDKRTGLAIALCFLIYLGWQKLYLEPRIPRSPQTSAQQAPAAEALSAPQAQAPAAPTLAKPAAQISPPSATLSRPEQTALLKTALGTVTVGNSSPFFLDWKLNDYHLGVSPQTPNIDLKTAMNLSGAIEFAFDDTSYTYLSTIRGDLKPTETGALWTYEDANLKLSKEFSTQPGSSTVDLKIHGDFKTKKPNFAFIALSSHLIDKDPEAQDRQLVYFTNKTIERVNVSESVTQKEVGTPVSYIGATSRYFLMAVLAQPSAEARGLIQPAGANTGRISLVYPLNSNTFSIPVKVFFGPKDLSVLRAADPLLDHTVDFGWFTVIAYPLLKILKWFYTFFGNYGVAIIFLTLLLKLVTYPLTYKSMKSMKEMASLQPQLQKLREKYKDDKETLNKEMMTMMKSHGYNPMAGCLPILIQMPVFFALYRVLYSSMELYHSPFIFWIRDLSAADPFYVTPVLLTITMFIQQKLTPNTAADPMQAKMMQFMPLMFGAMMLALPSGLTLYMLVNALASIGQQMMLNKKFNPPGNVQVFPARAK